jgi:catechol 2,3-dioxygenase-like lactoylglutathione lyase family enzyme
MTHPAIDQQITFLYARDLIKTRQFYSGVLGLSLVRDQSSCLIFSTTQESFLGFCEHIDPIQAERSIILTLVTDAVDAWYAYLREKQVEVLDAPKTNPKYQIYHFFLKDPNGYWIEIQKFDDPL